MLTKPYQKSQQNLKLIKKNERAPQVWDHFFSEKEFNEIIRIKDETVKLSPPQGRSVRKDGRKNSLFLPTDSGEKIIKNILTPKLKDKFLDVNFSIDSVHFFKTEIPYGIHADASADDIPIFQQMVVPLEVFPSHMDAYTIVMKQQIYYAAEFPLYKAGDQGFYNRKIYDRPKEVIGYKQWDSITSVELDKYWVNNHFWQEQLEGFSIRAVYKWKPRSVLSFDRSSVHCASLFKATGRPYKIGLAVATSLIV